MALDTKKSSAWWYAKVRRDGRDRLFNLNIRIEGQRPINGAATGDDVYERSRGRALDAHDRLLADLDKSGNIEELSQRIIESKTGSRSDATPLANLFLAWEAMPHDSRLGKPYVSFCKGIIDRFVSYIQTRHPKVKDLAGVTREMMAAFLKSEEQRGISPRTWTAGMILIRSIFKHLQPDADAYRRYLITVRGKTSETIHREPFTAAELQAILDAAKEDELIRPLIVVAASTAMRRGDCCLLKWKSVDLVNGFITVKTGKTGETVDMPIFPMLREELEKREQTGQYVFPEAAELYQNNPDNLNVRLQNILTKVGFKKPQKEKKEAKKGRKFPLRPLDETLARALAAVDMVPGRDVKRAAMRRTVELYLSGKSFGQVAKALDVSKGTVSGHLTTLEKLIEAPIIKANRDAAAELPERGTLHEETKTPRQRLANVRGWHSFRTTWITLALSAGLPMELVRRVSGHTTADVVLKHYFRPGREDFRMAVMKAMPAMLTGPADGKTLRENPVNYRPSPGEGELLAQAVTLLEGMTAKNWKAKRDEALELVRQVKHWYDGSILKEA